MKVLKNNYNNEKVSLKKVILPYPRVCVCDKCKSELSYEESDVYIDEYGAAFVNCPLCDYDNILDNNEKSITLTKDNVQFPTHFCYYSTATDAVNTCTNEYVKEVIRKGIKYLRTYKDDYFYYSGVGNTTVFVFKMSGDEEYQIYVANDYYNTYIPFESCDY